MGEAILFLYSQFSPWRMFSFFVFENSYQAYSKTQTNKYELGIINEINGTIIIIVLKII